MQRTRVFRRAAGLICSSAILMVAGVFTSAISSSAAPKANNGTVDITNVVGSGEGNQPKVDCPFNITFTGFDAGQEVSAVIDGHAPSGSGTVWSGSTTLDNNGDGSITVSSFDTSGLVEKKDGYHLDLVVAGDPPKHKTFWADCSGATSDPTTTTTTSTTVESTPTTVASTPTTVASTPTTTGGSTVTVPASQSVNNVTSDGQPAQVLGSTLAAPAAQPAAAPTVAATQVARTQLAHTGPNTKNLLIIATWLLALGGALVTFSKVGRVPAEG